MTRQNMCEIALAGALFVTLTGAVEARQWSDRTTLTFAGSVRVPGATLPAGNYVFELIDPGSSTGAVKITDEAGSRVYAIATVVPTRRPAAPEDSVLLFLPVEQGSTPAVRGWYPGNDRHGYFLLYSEEEARALARRTRSVVLSKADVDGSMPAGTVALTWPDGAITRWTQDVDTQREWDARTRTRREPAAMSGNAPSGDYVRVSELEDHSATYLGKNLNVAGRVDEVYGPHLFELDEPLWDRLNGDVLVFLPDGLLAAVRENDRVTVMGTLTQLSRSDVLGRARWLSGDAVMNRSGDPVTVLVATRIVSGNHDRMIAAPAAPAAGTTSVEPALHIREAMISYGDVDLVGRRIALRFVMIDSIDRAHGFFATAGGRSYFVMTTALDVKNLQVGDIVALDGTVLALPPTLAEELKMPSYGNTSIYVYAHRLESGG